MLGALYGVLLAMLCALAMERGEPSTRGRRRLPTWSASIRQRPTRQPIRRAGAVTLAVATPLLFTAILVNRERVAVDLLDQLDGARMESPMGMHGGFSRIGR